MKKLLFVAAIFFFLNITGCYTVIWSPGMDFPVADRTSEYNSTDTTDYYNNSSVNYSDPYGDVYYSEPYYGHYADYYNIPWWYSIPPPSVSTINNKNNGKAAANRSGDVSPIRNSGDGRGNSGRSTGDIINTPPVTVSGSGSTSSETGTSGSDVKKTDSDTGNKNDNPRQSTSSGSVRNNDGGRNDGGRK